MSSWEKIRAELEKKAKNTADGAPPFDAVLGKYLRILHQKTKRDVILYGSSWLQKRDPVSANSSMIDEKDVIAFKECVSGLKGGSGRLDLVLHSPGGYAESAEHIVEYLRSNYEEVRVIVPYLAMSAATLIACSADEVLMGTQSALGPIDPQIPVPAENGMRAVAAHDIIGQYEEVLCKSKAEGVEVVYPMFAQFGPDLIVRARTSIAFNEMLAQSWLKKYMLKGLNPKEKLARAKDLSGWLISREKIKSHSRCLLAPQLKERDFRVVDLEEQREVNEAVLSVFYTLQQMFEQTSVLKIVKNHQKDALLSLSPVVIGGVPNVNLRVEEDSARGSADM